jgi:hypothetical protein
MNTPTRVEIGPIEEAILALQSVADCMSLTMDESGASLARQAISAAKRLQSLRLAIARHDHKMDFDEVRPPNGDDYNEVLSLLYANTWGTAFGQPDATPPAIAANPSSLSRTRVLFEDVSMGPNGENVYGAVLSFDGLDLRLQVEVATKGQEGDSSASIASFDASSHQWRTLTTLNSGALKTRPVTDEADLRPEMFAQDNDELVRRALLILGR